MIFITNTGFKIHLKTMIIADRTFCIYVKNEISIQYIYLFAPYF